MHTCRTLVINTGLKSLIASMSYVYTLYFHFNADTCCKFGPGEVDVKARIMDLFLLNIRVVLIVVNTRFYRHNIKIFKRKFQ